jgi:hypothetical protein
MTTTYRPAFYSVSTGTGGVRDWVTVLHPPYTAWHLSYVAIGAALAPRFALWRLGGTLAAFFLAVGVAAHALDELHGRPLRTGIPSRQLVAAAAVGVVVPVGVGWWYGGLRLLPFIAAGAVLVVGYNLELAGGRLHNGGIFAMGWGGFPVLVGYYAQDFRLGLPALVAAVAACFLSYAQRALSTFARAIRRSDDIPAERVALLAPAEAALTAVAAGLVCLAASLVASR